MTCKPSIPAAAAALLGLLSLGTAHADILITGGGAEPLRVELTAPVTFTLPGGVGLADTELIYLVIKDIYDTDNPALEQEAFSSTSTITPGLGGATFAPFSADVLSFTIGDIGPRDVNFHSIADGVVADGDTLTWGVGVFETDAANANVRAANNLGSTVVLSITTQANGFFDLDTQTVNVVPEPTTAILLTCSSLAMLRCRRRPQA